MAGHSIGILGLGRFGRLTYEHLRSRAPRVWTRDTSKLAGVAGAASFEETAACDIVVMTVAISAMEETCRRMAPLLRPGQLGCTKHFTVGFWVARAVGRGRPTKAQ